MKTPNYKLSVSGFIKLHDYLKSHEDDIATRTNDFEDLTELFIEIIGRNPLSPSIVKHASYGIRK